MSELIFVRHGQASFGKAAYDKLSDCGVEQVRILAQHWHEIGEQFDCIYSGTLLRQRETADELLSLVKGQPRQAVENPSLNEYNGDALIQALLHSHAEEGLNPVPRWPVDDPKLFQQLFEVATAKWLTNELQPLTDDARFEYWVGFQHRVHSVIDEIMQRHRDGSRVLISTSGGVIALALQRVLQFPDEQVISTNWMVHNSSVTRVKYGNGKLSLIQFNNIAHLERAELQHMITYR